VRDRHTLQGEKIAFIVVCTVAIKGGRTIYIVGLTTKERAHKLRVVLLAGWLEFLGAFAELRLFCKGHDNVVHL
jgi:hypothetical protein